MKKNIIAGVLIFLFTPLTMTAAQETTLEPTRSVLEQQYKEKRTELRQELKEKLQTTVSALRKDKVLQEIDRRINRLNDLTEKIQAQSQIANLQNLRKKIVAETDPKELLILKKSIAGSYKVYALPIMKTQIIAHANRIINVSNTMADKTSNANALAKIKDANIQAQKAIDTVMPLTLEGFPGNMPIFKSARDMLKTALRDLKEARELVKKDRNSSSDSSSDI